MTIKKVFIILLLMFISPISMAASIKTIRFATEATYPPFEFIDASGQITGFDIEIAKALCLQIKAQCTFSNQSFNSLMPSLKLGKFDAIIAALGVTPERQKEVDFTLAYYEPSASFVALTMRHYSLADMQGKIIGTQQGSVFEKYLRDKYRNHVTIKTYASALDAFLDLVLGRLDAVIVDTPIAIKWLEQNQNFKQYSIVGKPIIDHEYFGSGYAIAVDKSNDALLNALNNALAEIKTNGTYEKIVKKYLSN